MMSLTLIHISVCSVPDTALSSYISFLLKILRSTKSNYMKCPLSRSKQANSIVQSKVILIVLIL